MLALHGADHEIGFGERHGIAAVDRDLEPARFLAERRATRILVERGIDGDQPPRSVVAGFRRAAPAVLSGETARDGRTCLAEAEQCDDPRRPNHLPPPSYGGG